MRSGRNLTRFFKQDKKTPGGSVFAQRPMRNYQTRFAQNLNPLRAKNPCSGQNPPFKELLRGDRECISKKICIFALGMNEDRLHRRNQKLN
jgi:hypothetical protein